MDDDASPEVLETMEAAANIHVDDTITPGVGLSFNIECLHALPLFDGSTACCPATAKEAPIIDGLFGAAKLFEDHVELVRSSGKTWWEEVVLVEQYHF